MAAPFPPLQHVRWAAQSWAGRHQWVVLDLAGAGGLRRLIELWAAWRADPARPRMLHVVWHAADHRSVDSELAALGGDGRAMVHALQQACWGLHEGIVRLTLDDGHVLLTLALGPRGTQLRELQMVADHLMWSHDPADDAQDFAKALARLSRHGAVLDWGPDAPTGLPPDWHKALNACGFRVRESPGPGSTVRAMFAPHWRATQPEAGRSSCVVVGAGLAGATVAASLARRGWRVQVLERAGAPAAGASGLPVGVLSPHGSADDNLLSRLSRSGVRMSWQSVQDLLVEGRDWAMTGLLELRSAPTGRADLPAWDLAADAHQLALAGLDAGTRARWHPHSGWVRPAAWVGALLAGQGIEVRTGSAVGSIVRRGAAWAALDPQGTVLAEADMMVVAGGHGSDDLMAGALGLRPVAGQISWGDAPERGLPACPVHGDGSLIPAVPASDGATWHLGATYWRDAAAEPSAAHEHEANLARLAGLLPSAARTLEPQFLAGRVQAWRGVRATTVDRLPLVGEPDGERRAGLFVSTGMGSRGLSLALLCAELLAAQCSGEPLPVGRRAAQALAAARARRWRGKDSPAAGEGKPTCK